ncbi:MAG: hypothetical protein ACTSPY_05175 [Candidatus Helarchaeota archaeon]
MKFVDWKEGDVKEFINKIEKIGWNKLEENSTRFIAGYTYDGNIFKIYKYPNKELYKVYYNSTPYFQYINKYDDMEKFQNFLSHFKGKKVIEIDDAGIGCPIGGIIICIYSKYRDLASLKIIGLKYFQKPLFTTKQYQKEVVKRILWAFKELEVTRDYFIRICPGDIFTEAIEFLWKKGYNIITTNSVDMAHGMAEVRFLQYLEKIGIPKEILDVNPLNIDYAQFHRSINRFLRENPRFKHRFFKTGWYKDRR